MVLLALKSALVLAFGLCLATVLRRRSAALRRGVLAATVLAVLALPVLSALVPGWPILGRSTPAVRTPEVPPAAQPFQWVSSPSAVTSPGPARTPGTAGAHPELPLALVVVGWALGVIAIAGRLGAGWLGIGRLIRRARPEPAWAQSCTAACAELGVPRRPVVLESEDVATPLVTGLLRPVILVPAWMGRWSPERRRLVLLHELAHVTARDGLLLAASHLVCALHWPNPLAWGVRRALRRAGEHAADDAVLRAGVRASDYAQGLLDAARGAGPVPLGAMAMARRASLEPRLRAVLATSRQRAPLTGRAATVLGALAVGATTLVACAQGQSAQAAEPPATTQAAPAAAAHAPRAKNGGHVDPRVQAIVDEEVTRTRARTGATAVSVVVLDARSGRILGAHDAGRVEAPGSTVKPLMVAAALAAGLPADARFHDEGGRWKHDGVVFRDWAPKRSVDVTDVLVRSSNIGAVKIAERLGPRALKRFLTRVGLGRGLPRTTDDPVRNAYVALGEGQTTTPLALATAYTALADDGVLARPSGAHIRVLPARVARTVRKMLEEVVSDAAGTGGRAHLDGVRVAGKTGTAHRIDPAGGFRPGQYDASFIGMVPADHPALVVLVGVVDPKGERSGGQVAAPVFARIARRVLALR